MGTPASSFISFMLVLPFFPPERERDGGREEGRVRETILGIYVADDFLQAKVKVKKKTKNYKGKGRLCCAC
jgi:hypothetical protein